MYNLFLDDERFPENAGTYYEPKEFRNLYFEKEWVIVRTYEEFVRHIEEHGLPELISFDHDLADIHYNPMTCIQSFEYREESGMDCAKWLVNYCLDRSLELPRNLVHSMNPVGRQNIESLFKSYNERNSKT